MRRRQLSSSYSPSSTPLVLAPNDVSALETPAFPQWTYSAARNVIVRRSKDHAGPEGSGPEWESIGSGSRRPAGLPPVARLREAWGNEWLLHGDRGYERIRDSERLAGSAAPPRRVRYRSPFWRGSLSMRRPPIRAMLRFPGSTEVRFLKRPPRRGQRIESASGDVWFVADVMRSGTDTYTIECVGLGVFLRELREQPSSDPTRDVLALARRPIRSLQYAEAGGRPPRGKVRRYIAAFAAANGDVLDYVTSAKTDEEAEREAREAAQRLGMTLLRVQRG